MSITFEQSCPQCGAPIKLQETDHLLQCSFCEVNSFLASSMNHLTFDVKQEEDIVFVPYLRFKGAVYNCSESGVSHKIVDLTQRGVPIKALPPSLGVRPQAVNLKLFSDEKGRRLQNNLTVKQAVQAGTSLAKKRKNDKVYQACIGETLSQIYFPVAVRNNRAYDLVAESLIGKLPADKDIFAPVEDTAPPWKPRIIGTLCPQCGWNLEGQGDSVVLLCRQCATAWRAAKNGFVQVPLEIMSGNDCETYVPFWKMEVSFAGADVHSYGDFMKFTHQPKLHQESWNQQKLFIWSPAFKIQPKIYLQLARKLTITQKEFDQSEQVPETLYPTTMPIQEAAESLPVILIDTACKKKDIVDILPTLKGRVLSFSLNYIPFKVSPHDLLQDSYHLSINQNALNFGRHL